MWMMKNQDMFVDVRLNFVVVVGGGSVTCSFLYFTFYSSFRLDSGRMRTFIHNDDDLHFFSITTNGFNNEFKAKQTTKWNERKK